MPEYEGSVVWFSSNKGYGFLKNNLGAEVFCHFSAINAKGYRTLFEGQQVVFDIVSGPKGPQAANVSVCGERKVRVD